MRILFPVVLAIILLASLMFNLLHFMPWESAMRIIGIGMSVIALISAVIYLPRLDTNQ